MLHPADVVGSEGEVGGIVNFGETSYEVTIGEDREIGAPHFNSIITICKGAYVVAQRFEEERE